MHVVIVGGGVAGAMAALAARKRGAEVTLLTRAPGATALYAGGMEICGELRTLAEREPYHPFARLGLDQTSLETALDEACAALTSALDRGGLEITGDWRTHGTYLDIHGHTRPAQLVPTTVAGGEIERLRGKRLALIGVPSVGEYDAETTAATITETLATDVTPAVATLDLGPAASLTDLFGLPAPRPDVGADVILYPPGFRDLPPNGVELLSAIPSPHGLRLHRALASALDERGVETRRGEVTTVDVDGRTVRSVGGVEADAFVLATGRYLGGGLVKRGTVREPLFDLGVFHEGRRVDREQAARLRHLEYLSPEPAFRTGLLAGERLRPLDWEGGTACDNLLAAGSVLGGYDYGREFGFGVPVLTGWLAGGWAAS